MYFVFREKKSPSRETQSIFLETLHLKKNTPINLIKYLYKISANHGRENEFHACEIYTYEEVKVPMKLLYIRTLI